MRFSISREKPSSATAVADPPPRIEGVVELMSALGPLVSELARSANDIQLKMASKNNELIDAAAELETMKSDVRRVKKFGIDTGQAIHTQDEKVRSLRTEIQRLEGQLKEVRKRGPQEFAKVKAKLAEAQSECKSIIVDALRTAAAAMKKADSLGRVFEDGTRCYKPVARNFQLASLDSALPPLPPQTGDSISGRGRFAEALRKYWGKYQPANESPHRRWPNRNDIKFFEKQFHAWKK